MQIFDIIKEIKTFPRLVRINEKNDRIRESLTLISKKVHQGTINIIRIIQLKIKKRYKQGLSFLN